MANSRGEKSDLDMGSVKPLKSLPDTVFKENSVVAQMEEQSSSIWARQILTALQNPVHVIYERPPQ